MPELTISLTAAERRQIDVAAAALGKLPEQMIVDELRFRYGVYERSGDVVQFRARTGEVIDGHR